jgi:hypothetical protein
LLDIYQAGATAELSEATRTKSDPFLGIIVKNCVWRAGAKNTSIRQMATSFLDTLLSLDMLDMQYLSAVFESSVFPVLLSNLDDDLLATRSNILSVFARLLDTPTLWTGACSN